MPPNSVPPTQILLRIERDQRLDTPARRLGDVGRRLDSGRAGSLLRGDALGHPLHPALTDVPIGCWTSALAVDLVGGRDGRTAARRLVALGVLSAVPTIATGLVDVSRREEPARRVGVVHAGANSIALMLYAWSWRDRRRGRHVRGVVLSLVAAGVATIGGLLGGHLAFGTAPPADDVPAADLTTTLPVG